MLVRTPGLLSGARGPEHANTKPKIIYWPGTYDINDNDDDDDDDDDDNDMN
jgi:hypothetical protein